MTNADWLDCGWDVPAAAVQHRTLLGIQLCCATDPPSIVAAISEGSGVVSVISFQGDIGKLSLLIISGGIHIATLLTRQTWPPSGLQ